MDTINQAQPEAPKPKIKPDAADKKLVIDQVISQLKTLRQDLRNRVEASRTETETETTKNTEKEDYYQKSLEIIDKHREVLRKENPSKLYMLENIFPGSLTYLFLDPPSNEKNLQAGTINFNGCPKAESLIGLGDFLNLKTQFIKVETPDGDILYGYRKDNVDFSGQKRMGFVDPSQNPPYVPIFSGYKFQAISKADYLQAKSAEIAKTKTTGKGHASSEAVYLEGLSTAKDELDSSWVQFAENREKIFNDDDDSIDNGENLRGESLWNNQAFHEKVYSICSQLGVNPKDMRRLFYFESGLNPKEVNKKSGATGLIQFMPSTARTLGTDVFTLRNMSGLKQLDYVYKYYLPYKGKLNSFSDLYIVTLYPYALYQENSYKLGSERGKRFVALIAKQNPTFAAGKDYITKQDVINKFERA